ncbi:MAG: T9SS type A sorting domain-containing protein, partial [Bacteroidia bacterium]
MKSFLHTAFILLGLSAFVNAQTAPTCSLDPAFISSNKVGVYPDSATNFVSGIVGTAYGQNLTVKVPKDTTSGPLHFCFNKFVLSTPTVAVNYGLPPGLNIYVNSAALQNGTVNGSPSFLFPGNANNCAVISGTPTAPGTYTLHMVVDAYATYSSGSCPATPNTSAGTVVSSQTLNYYIIKINALGINELARPELNMQTIPNPFSGKTKLRFTLPDQSPVKLTLHNTLGAKVFETTINGQAGENNYQLNAQDWTAGLYFYTIKYKNYSETKRLILYAN